MHDAHEAGGSTPSTPTAASPRPLLRPSCLSLPVPPHSRWPALFSSPDLHFPACLPLLGLKKPLPHLGFWPLPDIPCTIRAFRPSFAARLLSAVGFFRPLLQTVGLRLRRRWHPLGILARHRPAPSWAPASSSPRLEDRLAGPHWAACRHFPISRGPASLQRAPRGLSWHPASSALTAGRRPGGPAPSWAARGQLAGTSWAARGQLAGLRVG